MAIDKNILASAFDAVATKAIQENLNKNGYKVDVDGIMGPQTASAMSDYFTKNGYMDNVNAVTSSASSGGDTVAQAQTALKKHMYFAPGEYQSKWQSQIDKYINDYTNREPFSYDIDSDALYQQYADQYARKGELAMMDTVGQASAMTGGYGNSYAVTAGSQAYQSYLQGLNDVVPELYGMAYDKYNQEGQDMLTAYSLLSEKENADYAKYQDNLSKYYADRDYLTDRYESERAADQWKQEFDFQKEQYEDSKALVTTGGGSGGSEGSGNTTNENSNNSSDTIPSSIASKAASFSNNSDLAQYLDGVTASGSITADQADKLFAENRIPEQAPLKDRTWTLVDGGGINWFWGIDNNAVVKDNYGNSYKLGKLKDALIAEGMSKEAAKEYVMNLQERLGA